MKSLRIILCISAMLVSTVTYATSIDFTATVIGVNNTYLTSSDGLIGQTGTGHIVYDLNPDSTGISSSGTYYRFDNATFSFELPDAGMAFIAGSSNSSSILSSHNVSVNVTNDRFTPTRDRIRFFGNRISQNLEGFDTRLFLGFFDSTATTLTNESLSNILIPSLYDTSFFQISIGIAEGTTTSGLSFSLDSVAVSNVPIPSAILFFGSSLLGLIGLNRPNKWLKVAT